MDVNAILIGCIAFNLLSFSIAIANDARRRRQAQRLLELVEKWNRQLGE